MTAGLGHVGVPDERVVARPRLAEGRLRLGEERRVLEFPQPRERGRTACWRERPGLVLREIDPAGRGVRSGHGSPLRALPAAYAPGLAGAPAPGSGSASSSCSSLFDTVSMSVPWPVSILP